MPESNHQKLAQVIAYMKSHWPSDVKKEWQINLEQYSKILPRVLADFTKTATRTNKFIRIAGLSGSGKTSQILPAVEVYCQKHQIHPVLVAARRFVDYHPFKDAIKKEYGEANLRKKTDEFSTIMMFLVLSTLTKAGYDIILDVTLLDPNIEEILIEMLKTGNYHKLLLMIATSPAVAEHFLGGRGWRHSETTEKEFIRATREALIAYASKDPELRVILWSVYDLAPIYDGPIKDSLEVFAKYSSQTDLPPANDDLRREAKISYLSTQSF